MHVTALPQQNNSRDAALAAIAEAHRLMAQADDKLVQFDELEKVNNETRDLSHERLAKLVKKSLSSRFAARIFVGLLALTCLGAAVVAWQPSQGHRETEPSSTSSVSIKKEGLLKQPATNSADLAAGMSAVAAETQAQGKLQPVPTTPVAAPMAPELAQQVQTLVRELANVEQGIGQLETEHSQIVHENGELIERLKATQEIARHNADLIEDLRASQAQITRDNVNLAGQLKASQELMANIAEQLKESREQVARPVVSEQKQRARTLVSSPPTIANSTQRPVPVRAAPVRTQAQGPTHLQP
jgi:cytoskeletal protein RodZ